MLQVGGQGGHTPPPQIFRHCNMPENNPYTFPNLRHLYLHSCKKYLVLHYCTKILDIFREKNRDLVKIEFSRLLVFRNCQFLSISLSLVSFCLLGYVANRTLIWLKMSNKICTVFEWYIKDSIINQAYFDGQIR